MIQKLTLNSDIYFFIVNELRCYLRNRRLSTYFWLSIFLQFTFMLVVVDWSSNSDVSSFKIAYVYLILTIPPSFVGQFLFNKDGSFFDAIVSRPVNMKIYVTAKLSFLMLYTIFNYLLVSPVMSLILPIYSHVAVSSILYNLGINVGLISYLSCLSTEKIDYLESAVFNYDGISFGKQLAVLPPVTILFFTGNKYDIFTNVMMCSGLIGLLTTSLWHRMIYKTILRRKYIMLQGFNE